MLANPESLFFTLLVLLDAIQIGLGSQPVNYRQTLALAFPGLPGPHDHSAALHAPCRFHDDLLPRGNFQLTGGKIIYLARMLETDTYDSLQNAPPNECIYRAAG